MKLPCLEFSSPEEVRAFRKKTGLLQTPFGNRVGVSQSGGSRYEAGRRIPEPVQILLTIAYSKPAQSQRMIDALLAWRT